MSSTVPAEAGQQSGGRYVLRTARPDDAAQIAHLAGELGYPSSAASMHARLVQLGVDPRHWVAVATPARAAPIPAGSLAPGGAATRAPPLGGWVHVARCTALESGEWAEILGLVVDGQVRRAGVGRLLAQAAQRWAQGQGLARLVVRSNAARVQAHDFYPALGFTRAKTQHVYVKTLPDSVGTG